MASLSKAKRSISPQQQLFSKKFKSEDAVGKWGSPTSIDCLPPPPNGVERIPFESSGPRRGDPAFRYYYRRKVTETINALAHMGKRVVGQVEGIWFDDGVTLHWIADQTVQAEAAPSLLGHSIVMHSTKTMMEDAKMPLSGPNSESGRNAFEAIIISDSEDDQGTVSAPSESSRGADWELSSRDGSLAQNSSFSSATSLSRGSSDDSCMLKPELIASGSPSTRSFVHVSDSILNPSSNMDVIPLEEAQAAPESGPTQQKTPTYIDVNSSSDMDYDSFVNSGQHDESSFTSPEVENILSPSASTRQGMPSLNPGLPGLLEKIFASDFEEASSEAESRHETSSDEDRPFALAKAIATPLRELMQRPARNLDINGSDSDASDSLEGQNVAFNLFSTGLRRLENDAPTSFIGRRIRRQHSESSDGDDDKEPSPSPSSRSKEPVRRFSNMGLPVRSTNHEAHNRALVASSSGTDRTKASSTSLPKAPNGKARRVLVPETPSLPLVTISMRADANFLDRNKEHCPRVSCWSIPNQGELRHVEDAAIVGDTVVIGYDDGPCQVSIISLTQGAVPQVVDIPHQPHTARRGTSAARMGVSCITSVQSSPTDLRFASGGYDKRVHLWTVPEDGSPPISECTPVVHNAFVQALVYRPSDHCLMSGAGSLIYRTDLRRHHKPRTVRLSNVLYQIHIHPQEPHLTILEVNHLDHQIQIFDKRQGDFDRAACLQFGYRTLNNKAESRYSRGSAHYNFFGKGYGDGTVKLWDYRNVKDVSVAMHRRPSTDAVIHTGFSGSKIVAFGGHVVDFWEYKT